MQAHRLLISSLILAIGCASPAEKSSSFFSDDAEPVDSEPENPDPEDDPETDTGDPEDIHTPDDPLDTGMGVEDPVEDPPVNGSSVYSNTCRECHGYPTTFAERIGDMTEADVFDWIRYGGGDMPAQDHLSDQEILAVMEYLND